MTIISLKWLKSLGLKTPGLKIEVEKSRVKDWGWKKSGFKMSFNHCKVIERKTQSSKNCAFPFIYKNETYFGCTAADSEDRGGNWCSTQVRFFYKIEWHNWLRFESWVRIIIVVWPYGRTEKICKMTASFPHFLFHIGPWGKTVVLLWNFLSFAKHFLISDYCLSLTQD